MRWNCYTSMERRQISLKIHITYVQISYGLGTLELQKHSVNTLNRYLRELQKQLFLAIFCPSCPGLIQCTSNRFVSLKRGYLYKLWCIDCVCRGYIGCLYISSKNLYPKTTILPHRVYMSSSYWSTSLNIPVFRVFHSSYLIILSSSLWVSIGCCWSILPHSGLHKYCGVPGLPCLSKSFDSYIDLNFCYPVSVKGIKVCPNVIVGIVHLYED